MVSDIGKVVKTIEMVLVFDPRSPNLKVGVNEK
jgi:hypothetical protein